MSGGGESTKVILIALVSNLGVAAAKLVGAFISGSASLLAEGIHTIVDCVNQVLLLYGSKLAKKAPSKSHPLGYGREAFFWSFVVAILLFSLGGIFAIYEGIEHYKHPEPVASPVLCLVILAVCTALELNSYFACMREVNRLNTYGSLWAWFRKSTSAEMLVVYTEHAASVVGLVLAFASLFMSWYTDNGQWDAIGSLLVGIVLVIVSILLSVEIKSLLIGESPDTDFRAFLDAKLKEKIPGSFLYNLIALQIGPNDVMLSCKISAGSVKEVEVLLKSMNEVERETKAKFPEVKWLFLEPDHED